MVVMSDGRFAGVDWASEEHAVCVVDERGRILEGRRYRHDEPGIRALCSPEPGAPEDESDHADCEGQASGSLPRRMPADHTQHCPFARKQ